MGFNSIPVKRITSRLRRNASLDTEKLLEMLEEAESKVDTLSKELTLEKSENLRLNKEVKKFQKAPRFLQSEYRTFGKENDNIVPAGTTIPGSRCDHRAELTSLRSELRRSKDLLMTAEEDRVELKETSEALVHAKAECAELEQRIHQHEKDKASLQEQVNVLETQVANSTALNKGLLSEIEELTEIMQEIQNSFNTVTPDIEVDSVEEEMKEAAMRALCYPAADIKPSKCRNCSSGSFSNDREKGPNVSQKLHMVQALLSSRHLRKQFQNTFDESEKRPKSCTSAGSSYKRHWALESNESSQRVLVTSLNSTVSQCSQATIFSTDSVDDIDSTTIVEERHLPLGPKKVVSLGSNLELGDLGVRAFWEVILDLKSWLRHVASQGHLSNNNM